ncbi:MAG: hypothetical protein LH468_04005 [Nocardioides sp.]|nr:hypothetical protein [Nocardioides sp.]
MTTTPSTQDQAQQAAGIAADEGRHVAGVASDEAATVAAEAKSQARGLMHDARTQVDDQTRTQRDRLVGTLHTVSDDLDSMASQGAGPGLAGDLARQAAERTRALGQHLDGREPTEILQDVRRFARERPGTFLLGALAAGVVVGRLARGAKDGASTSTGPTTVTGPTGTASTPVVPPVGPASVLEPTLAEERMPGQPTVTSPASFEDPLGGQDGSLGAAVPPNPTGRYEP